MQLTHFCATALDANDGYTWTLTTRLGSILHEIEEAYGSRDSSWTVLGVEFGPDTPQLWYPGNRKHVVVQLAMNAIDDTPLACYQLAHECVHLLAPGGRPPAPVIEEGLATVFSENYVERNFGLKNVTSLASYKAAAAAVRELFSLEPSAIRKLRAVQPGFRQFTHDTFAQAGLAIPSVLVAQLLLPFQRQ